MTKFSKTKATLILITASIGSNVLGMVRNHFFASRIPSATLGSYYAAFRIPDLLFNLVVLGVLSSVFIPVFMDHIAKDDKKSAWDFTNHLINLTIISLAVLSAVLFFLMPYLTSLITPGFSEASKDLTAKLAQIMLLSPIIFGLSSIAGGILNSFKKFTAYALAPLFYNAGIIFGTVYLTPYFGVYGLAYGVLLGAALHFLIQVPSILKLGYRYRPILDLKDKSLREVLRLAPPRIGGLLANQANLFILTIVGSIIGGGSIAYLNLANDTQTFVSVVFGISFATAIFPLLTEKASLGKTEDFIKEFSLSFRQILFFTIPASIGLILLRGQITRLILGYGFFKIIDTKLTAAVLGALALSLFAQATTPLLVRAFYALKDTKTPFYAAFFSVLVNLAGALTLPHFFSQYAIDPERNITFAVVGLALSFTIASFFNMIYLLGALHKRLESLHDGEIINSLSKVVVATFFMALSVQGLKYFISPVIDPLHPVIGFTTQTLTVIVLGAGVYFFFAWLFKCEEMKGIKTILRRPTSLVNNSKELE